jgi:hexosaminidase
MMYLADPIPADTKLTADQQKLILGGEATMWAEQLHEETVDSRVWPRLLAIAERFWSPQSRRDVPDMYRRLRIASLQLEDTGLMHISGPETLRRNLIASTHPGDTDTWVIDTFAAALEPVSFGERSDTQKTDALQSLNRLVDAVVADPPLRQDFNDQVQDLLDPGSTTEARALAAAHLREIFEQWQKASPELQTLALESPRLSDIGPRAHQLGDLADTGLEALALINAGAHPSADWKTAKEAQITEAEKPSALIRFVFLPSLKKLIEAAAN